MATNRTHIPHNRLTEPAHTWRGVLIDSSHTFWTIPVMKTVIDLMSRYGFNILHWQLTGDAGWRIPIPTYPYLSSIGASLPREAYVWKDPAHPTRARATWQNAPAHSTVGCYSVENIRRLVSYARQRHIEIVPEVSIPGHMGAAIWTYPALGRPHLNGQLPRTPTHRNDMLSPTREAFCFINAVLNQVCDLFPSRLIHLGADGWRANEWEQDNATGTGKEIYRSLTSHAIQVLHSRGRRVAVWEEASASGLDLSQAVVFSSLSRVNPPVQHPVNDPAGQVIAHPYAAVSSSMHFPRLRSTDENVTAYARHWVAHFSHAPAPSLSSPLTGLEICFSSEFLTTPDALFYHLIPALLTGGEIAWHGRCAASWDKLSTLVTQEALFLHQRGASLGPTGRAERHQENLNEGG